jgi:hypothetical protein
MRAFTRLLANPSSALNACYLPLHQHHDTILRTLHILATLRTWERLSTLWLVLLRLFPPARIAIGKG